MSGVPGQRQVPPAIRTRRPTGKPPWPIVLLAGAEKSGKSYALAQASASEHVGRAFWVSVGEDDPDELGALPGADFEIVEHDGTYRGVLAALTAAAAQPRVDGKPTLLGVDSMTRIWDLLCDMAQVTANQRAANKAEKAGRPVPLEDADISMDLWNTAKDRWQHIIGVLREHDGPVVVTARMEQATVMAGGKPTTEKTWKVKAEKSLPFDVGVIVEMPRRGDTFLTGVRSLRFKPDPNARDGRTEYPDFTVEKLWADLGVLEEGATSPRQHTANLADRSPADALLREIAELAGPKGSEGRQQVAAAWAAEHDGQSLNDATDLGGLELLRDDLAAKAAAAKASAA